MNYQAFHAGKVKRHLELGETKPCAMLVIELKPGEQVCIDVGLPEQLWTC